MWSATKDGRQQQRGSVFEKKRLTRNADLVSSFSMIRDHLIETRQRLIAQLPVTGEILRGSLFERTVRHTRGCTICAGGGGHPLWVLSVGYAGGRTRQFSLRREQVDEVRGWLGNYHQLREALEAICELNHALLRPDDAAPRRARQTGD